MRWWIIIALIAVAIGALAVSGIPWKAAVSAVLLWMQGLGPWSIPVFVGLYVVTALLVFVPITPLSLVAGFLYGLKFGLISAWLGTVLCAVVGYGMGRALGQHPWFARWTGGVRAMALSRALQQRGFSLVLLARFSPVFPYTSVNMLCGAGRIRVRDFLGGTALGVLPILIFEVYVGSLLHDISEVLSGTAENNYGTAHFVFLALGVIATLIVVVLVTRAAQRALRSAGIPVDKEAAS